MQSRFSSLILFLSLIISFSPVSSQSISFHGNVTDTLSQPIRKASVSILNRNERAITNTDGYFRIKGLPPGRYKLRISAIGYATKIKPITIHKDQETHNHFILQTRGKQLNDVIITAEKKEEQLQKTPAALSVLSSKEMAQYRIWNTNEITGIVPNLYSAGPGDNRNITSIRGIGSTSYDPAVATYIDGVNQFTLDSYIAQLFDVKRIEVLRGPQGTLYGRNAMGGVINIITNPPADTLEAFAKLSYGNYHHQRYVAGISSPLVKHKLYLGAAIMYNQRDGFYTNTFLHESYDKQHALSGNYYLKYMPTNRWKISLNFKHQNNRNKGAFPLAGSIEDALDNPYKIQQNAVGKMIDNTLFGSLSIKYEGASIRFSSQTAYQSNLRYYDQPLDGDFSPIDAVTIINDYGSPWNKVKTWTQEFKLNSTTDSPIEWTAGVYLFSDKEPDKQATHYGKDAGLMGVPDSNFSTINTSIAKNKGIAVYGQATYHLLSRLDIIAGLRYDFEHKDYLLRGDYQKGDQPIVNTQPDTSATTQYGAFSPKAGLSYQLTKNNHLYFTYSRGFRTGGMTQLSDNPSEPPLREYKPEYSNNLEIGSKNDFFDQRLRANLTLFLSNITGIQVPTLILPEAITIIRNAGKLESKGIELEVSALPVKGLEVNYNFGFTEAHYTQLKLSEEGSSVNLKGKKQIYTPKVTSMLGLQYSYTLNAKKHLKLTAHGDWNFIGKQYFDLNNKLSQDPYHLFNAQVGLVSKHIDLTLWGKNLSGQKYIAYAYDFGAAHLGDPKTYGVTIGLKL